MVYCSSNLQFTHVTAELMEFVSLDVACIAPKYAVVLLFENNVRFLHGANHYAIDAARVKYHLCVACESSMPAFAHLT